MIRALLSWFPVDRGGALFQMLDQLTEPILEPLRRIVPRVGMIDITPLVAMLALQFIARAVAQQGI